MNGKVKVNEDLRKRAKFAFRAAPSAHEPTAVPAKSPVTRVFVTAPLEPETVNSTMIVPVLPDPQLLTAEETESAPRRISGRPSVSGRFSSGGGGGGGGGGGAAAVVVVVGGGGGGAD